MTPNTILLLNDGRIRLQIIEQGKDFLKTEILNDGVISNNKGVNIPDVILPIDSLTSKDKSDLKNIKESLGSDYRNSTKMRKNMTSDMMNHLKLH